MSKYKEHWFNLPSFFCSLGIIAIIVLASLFGSHILFTPRSSETYTGELSQEQYYTMDDACYAFLNNEVNGMSTNARFLSFERVETIPAQNFTEYHFNIDNTHIFLSAEKIKILYALENGDIKETYTYVFKTEDDYYNYYTPAIPTGEQLSKDYLDSVMWGEAVPHNLTCHQETCLTFKIYNVPISVKTNCVIEVSETAIHQYFFAKGIGLSQSYDVYFIEDEKGIHSYCNLTLGEEESGWIYLSPEELGISTLNEILIAGPITSLDHTFFTKTTTGFQFDTTKQNSTKIQWIEHAIKKLRESYNDIYKELKDEEVKEMFDKVFEMVEKMYIDSDYLLQANFTVSNGVISNYSAKTSFSFGSIDFKKYLSDFVDEIPDEEEVNKFFDIIKNISIDMTDNETFRKYGETTVEIPQEIIKLHENISNQL